MSSSAASLYVRKGKCYVTALSRSIDGFWFESEPVFVEDGVDLARLSLCIRQALEASRTEVPAPRRDALASRLPALAGVKSFGSFMKGAVSVDVSADGDRIKLTPMRNGGARRGFEFKNEEAVLVEDAEALASGLAMAIAAAE
jgi:hypothetical protein